MLLCTLLFRVELSQLTVRKISEIHSGDSDCLLAQWSGDRVPAELFLRQNFQTGFWANPASYVMVTRVLYGGLKLRGA